ncbi:MAG: AAA family ATPase [Deltaproteobacteria bacterium]|nr:AAA family ATPase [Deltaproteobacteria bacterium]
MRELNGFKHTEKLHQSSKSVIYRATGDTDGRQVVLKYLHSGQPSEEATKQIEHAFKLSSTAGLTTSGTYKLELTPHEHGWVIIAPDADSVSLDKLLSTNGPFDTDTFLDTALQITQAIAAMHQNKIVHNDICPRHIIVHRQTKTCQIIDFDSATALPKERVRIPSSNAPKESLPYISPERTGQTNHLVDYRSDLYSLGMIFFEMLTGGLPFNESNSTGVVTSHISRLPHPPSQLSQTIPAPVSDIVMKLLSKNPEDRYQSESGLIADLLRCQQQLDDSGQIEKFAVGQSDTTRTFHIPETLYGRGPDIDVLSQSIQRIAKGQAEVFFISGEPGIGKTSLVNELYRPVAQIRGHLVQGKFNRHSTNQPYTALIQAFDDLVMQILAGSKEEIGKWKNEIISAVGDNGALITSVIPSVIQIIGPQPPLEPLPPAESQNRFRLVFQNFIRACASHSHPLILVADDLQWGDNAYLKLLWSILTDTEIEYFLFIGIYRENEVDTTHPLTALLHRLEKSPHRCLTMHPAPLKLDDVQNILGTALHYAPIETKLLAELILHKTAGNPLFTKRFVESLVIKNYIIFDDAWLWDMEQIENAPVEKTVERLITQQFQTYSASVLELLKIAACLGDRCTLTLLCELTNRTMDDVLHMLGDAFGAQLVIKSGAELHFAHDHMREAVRLLTNDEERLQTHYRIGNHLLTHPLDIARPKELYEAAYHLNNALELLNNDEKQQLLKLNIEAAQLAKTTLACESAIIFFRQAKSLLQLQADFWKRDYPTARQIFTSLAETAYLSQNHIEAEDAFSDVIKNAESVLDTIDIHRLKVSLLAMDNMYKASFDLGINILQQLDIELLKDISIQSEMARTTRLMGSKDPLDLLELPMMTDEKMLKITSLMEQCLAPAFYVNQTVLVVLLFKILNASITYGNTPFSPYVYSYYAFLLAGMKHYTQATRFAQLGIELGERTNMKRVRGRSKYLSGMTLGLTGSLVEGYRHIIEGARLCRDGGDNEYAAYNSQHRNLYELLLGRPLQETWQKSIEDLKWTRQTGNTTAITIHTLAAKVILSCLSGHLEHRVLLYNDAPIDHAEIQSVFADNNPIRQAVYQCFKPFVMYIYNKHEEIKPFMEKATEYLSYVSGTVYSGFLNTYHGLNLAAQLKNANSHNRDMVAQIQEIKKNIDELAEHNPTFFLNKRQLLDAELARILGKHNDAVCLYDDAVATAKDNNLIYEQAIALECAGKYHFSKNDETTAARFMQEAHRCYATWGCPEKVRLLENKFSALLQLNAVPEVDVEKNTRASTAPDFPVESKSQDICDPWNAVASVIQACLTISEAATMDSAVTTLMTIAQKNTGAQKGVLVLRDNLDWHIAAIQDSNNRHPVLPAPIPLENSISVPVRLLKNTVTEQKIRVIEDVAESGLFADDPYIQKHKIQSVICAPIARGDNFIGVLYLENHQSTGEFSQQNVQFIEAIASQAAISIEIVREIENLKKTLRLQNDQKVDWEKQQSKMADAIILRTEELQAEKEKVNIANRANKEFLSFMSQELLTPLNAVLGYTQILIAREYDVTKRAYLHTIQQSGDALLSCINDILDLSQLESERFHLAHTAANVRRVLGEIETVFARKITEQGIDFRVIVDDNVPEWLRMAESSFRQVLLRLIGNAAKFTSHGDIIVRCQLDHRNPAKPGKVSLRVDITDTGKGIAQDEQQRISELLGQDAKLHSMASWSSGLGLVTVRRLAEAMNGEIEFQSSLDKGSVFTFTIRNMEIATAADESAQTAPLLAPDNISFDFARILIADDIDYNRQLMSVFLQPYGFELQFAQNGNEALERIQMKRPDVLLLDMKMPTLSGEELAEILKGSEEYRTIPIIAVSASTMPTDEARIQSICDGFLRKPISREQLLTELSRHIHHYHTELMTDIEGSKVNQPYIVPSVQTLKEFYELSIDGDMDGICHHIDSLLAKAPQYAGFCDPLKVLAKASDDVKLADILIAELNAHVPEDELTT